MGRFYAWHPHVLATDLNALAFIVTFGSSDHIFQGTEEFVRGFLVDLGIPDPQIVAWTLSPARSKYFSDYIGEGNWRDDWQLVFSAVAKLKNPLSAPPVNTFMTSIDSSHDPTWSVQTRLRLDASASCLLICNFNLEWIAEQITQSIIQSEVCKSFQSKYGVGLPKFEKLIWKTPEQHELTQLHIDLGIFSREYYMQGADYAEFVLGICRSFGATTHYSKFL